MTRHRKVIPASFQQLDSTLGGSSSRYLSVRDRQKILENFNIILARTAQQPLVHEVFGYQASPGADGLFLINAPTGRPTLHVSNASLLYAAHIRLPPPVKQVRVTVYCEAATSAPGNITRLWARISQALGPNNHPGASNTELTVTGLSGTQYGDIYWADIDVAQHDNAMHYFSLWFQGLQDGTDIKTGSSDPTIKFVGSNYLDIDDSTSGYGIPTVGWLCYISSNLSVVPQVITRTEALSGGDYRIWFRRAWGGEMPVFGDTINFRLVAKLEIHSVNVSPLPVTDFEAEVSP